MKAVLLPDGQLALAKMVSEDGVRCVQQSAHLQQITRQGDLAILPKW